MGTNKRLDIGVDMDGIAVDLTPHWLRCIEADHGVKVGMHEINQWSLHRCGALVQLGAKKVYDYMHKPGFFRTAPPIDPAVAAIKRLATEHNVFIISSPAGGVSAQEKYEWLAEHLPELKNENICLFPTKTKIKMDVLIDDKAETLIDYRAAWPEALCLGIEYEYNKHVKSFGLLQVFESYRDPMTAWGLIEDHIHLRSLTHGAVR